MPYIYIFKKKVLIFINYLLINYINSSINRSIENIKKSKILVNKIEKELTKVNNKNEKIKIEFKPTIKIEVYGDEKLNTSKKSSTKKSTAKKSTAKKSTVKKSSTKKVVTKKKPKKRVKKTKTIKNRLYKFLYLK